MTIQSKQPLTLIEVKSIVDKLDEKDELQKYLKKFTKIKKDKAADLKKDLEGLNNLKIKEENIIKLIDHMPKDAEDVNKVFTEVSLSEEETNAILDIVRKY
jgi:DNA-directed RNA polymerase subunit F